MKEIKEFLTKLNEAFAKSDSEYIIDKVSDDVRWNIIGDQIIEGKDSFSSVIREMETDEAFILRINNIVSQGSTAVVDGTIQSKSPIGDNKSYAFCDIYKFANTDEPLIEEITSYVIEQNKKASTVNP